MKNLQVRLLLSLILSSTLSFSSSADAQEKTFPANSVDNLGYGLAGMWFNNDTSPLDPNGATASLNGQGFQGTYVQKTRQLIMMWFTHKKDGSANAWLYGDGVVFGGNSVTFNAYKVTNARHLVRTNAVSSIIGTFTITLMDCQRAVVTWNLSTNVDGLDQNGSLQLSRLASESVNNQELCSTPMSEFIGNNSTYIQTINDLQNQISDLLRDLNYSDDLLGTACARVQDLDNRLYDVYWSTSMTSYDYNYLNGPVQDIRDLTCGPGRAAKVRQLKQ